MGYSNCLITEESGQLLAFCLFGYVLVPLAVPFGVTNGAAIHQRNGLLYTSFARSVGCEVSQYLDDHPCTGFRGESTPRAVQKCMYALLYIKGVAGGYWFSTSKSQFVPTPTFEALGVDVCRREGAFRIPGRKVAPFVDLGDQMLATLEDGRVAWASLARFSGKAMAFVECLPHVRLFCNAQYIELGKRPLSSDLPGWQKERVPWWHRSRLAGSGVGAVRAAVLPLLQLEIRSLQRLVRAQGEGERPRLYPWVCERHVSICRLCVEPPFFFFFFFLAVLVVARGVNVNASHPVGH